MKKHQHPGTRPQARGTRHEAPGFTLVELLVVVVVIVTLMTITFKLAGAGGDSTYRNITVNRMQRIENCLSGYYAAYGSYPPVALHGSRDYTYKADSNSGLQAINSDERISGNLSDNWSSVEAACRSQPFSFEFPFNESMADYIQAYCEDLRRDNPKIPMFTALTRNGQVSSLSQYTEWSKVQIYKYGVMSYLLPRYLVVMMGSSKFDQQLLQEQHSWNENNQLPCRFENGAPYASWNEVNDDIYNDPWKIAALPSQAITARWLPNLTEMCCWPTPHDLYGVTIKYSNDGSRYAPYYYSVGGYGNESSYTVRNFVSIKDGWGNIFYYYSPSPHQSYTIWSAGKNGKTFPPWVTDEERSQLSSGDRDTVQTWVADDIMQMSN